MDNAALIDHGPAGVVRSVSEIPLVASLLSSSASCSSPPREQEQPTTGNPSGGNNNNAAPASTVGQPSSSSSSSAPAAPAIATPLTAEDVSKLDLAIMACSIGLVVPMTLYIKDFTGSWETPWKVLYGVLLILSFASTVTGFFTAWCPAVSWGRRLSPTCARLGLGDAAALFIVFLACKLGRFGCAAGVGAAALVVLVLAVVWAWSERRSAATAPAQGGVGLPDDVP